MTRDAMIASRIDECTVCGTRRPENFPVASLLLAPGCRVAIRAYYRFARFADDIADAPDLAPAAKLAALDALDAALRGEPADEAAVDTAPAVRLRAVLAERGMETGHARALLAAFRRDAEGHGTADWDELMRYCRASAAPVGRFLLDLHREPRRATEAADALCAALQVLNHVQDIAEDKRLRDRVYVPLSWPDGARADAAEIDAPAASPALRGCLDRTLANCARLLDAAEPLPGLLQSPRLRGEAAATLSLAHALHRRLCAGDPLAARIRPTAFDVARAAAAALSALVAPPSPGLLPPEARRTVAAIVRESGSSFRLGLSCLPRLRREAMQTVYAFCRVLDDIADDPGMPREARLADLDAWSARLDALERNAVPADAPPLFAALAAADARFGLDIGECRSLIEGMRMDVEGPIVAPDETAFALYCRRVAGSIGLISLPLFGARDAAARRFALTLGDALQCVNIIRDVAEDAEIGRCYLPRTILEDCGIPIGDAASIAAHPAIGRARELLAARAETHFALARGALTAANARALLPARAMMAAYRDVLDRIAKQGWSDLSPPPRAGMAARLYCLLTRLPRRV
ncbi:squalene/phytoene synthase family protein [Oleispirillum naphthae]|uniref:squalene/phytoene synthase family protein n=1 Tax=Oleispirillum naphthae TaxID=2838853 RepID=UPI0030825FB8